MTIIIMGVSGCGKTTIGKKLSQKLQLPFYDADDFHPENNIQKMAQGIPLCDDDRTPWLEALNELLKKSNNSIGVILACSALKEKYRIQLQKEITSPIHWVHLQGSEDILKNRLETRTGHFMSPLLLKSQFDCLESPSYAQKISIAKTPEEIVNEIVLKINSIK